MSVLAKFDAYAMLHPKTLEDVLSLLDEAIAVVDDLNQQLDQITKNCENNRGKE